MSPIAGCTRGQVYDINQPTAGALQANPGVNVNYLRPYQGFAAIQEEESGVNSMYSSLQVTWNRRFKNGSMFGVTYTLSKSMDGSSNYRDIVPDTYNTSNLWGPSEYDTRHIVIVNYLYDLPFFKNSTTLKGKLLGGWEIAGAAQFQTGTPCGIGTNNDFAGVGEFGSFGCGSQGQYWISERAGHRQHRSLCRTRHHIRFSHLLFGQRHATGSRHLQPAARRTRLGLPARHSGLESVPVQEIRHQRADRLPVSSGGIRLPQSSEPEHAEPQSDLQPVRHDHQQDGPRPPITAFLAVLLLTSPLWGSGSINLTHQSNGPLPVFCWHCVEMERVVHRWKAILSGVARLLPSRRGCHDEAPRILAILAPGPDRSLLQATSRDFGWT